MNNQLFDESDDSSENGFELTTNQDYAKSYNHLRKKELVQKFNNKRSDDSHSETSSDSDSSEEDEVLDPTFDQEFLQTLASLKSKDPTIYDKNIKFFEKLNKGSGNEGSNDDANDVKQDKAKKLDRKKKPVTLKDYERKIILEKGGKFVDDSDEDNVIIKNPFRPASPSLAEEDRHLRAEFKKVMEHNDSSDEEFGGIFKKREKSKSEQDKEEEDYLKWMAGKNNVITEEAQEKLKPLKTYWSNEKLPPSEKFLRDYILNKGYTDANNYSEIPTYMEIVGDNAPLSEDEDELEKQAEFEHKFNFRFEDPDQEFIKRYPRTVESSVRVTDDKRKQKRQETKERKAQEKEDKLKELKMVKEMKRKEIEEKIRKLKMVTGNDELAFKDDDLEEDFDPEAHDRRMRELFNDDYYQYDEGEEKPECPSDIDDLKVEDWDNYDPDQEWNDGVEGVYEAHCEDDDFIMDCDYDPVKAKEELQKELIENTRKRKGRKGRRDRFMEIIKAEKPVFNPEDEKTYGEYIDEYYKLDCEDIIGDTPCRFKYVETTANDFGLTIEEILLAKNKELNQWASLKKAIQIRPDQVEKKEQRMYKLKAKNEDLKRKIFKSLYGEGSDNELDGEETSVQEETTLDVNKQIGNKTSNKQEESKKSKKRRKRKAENTQLTVERKSSKVDNKQNESEIECKIPKLLDTPVKESDSIAEHQAPVEIKKKRKNRKNKQNQNNTNINNNDIILGTTTNKTNETANKRKLGNQGTVGNDSNNHTVKAATDKNYNEFKSSLIKSNKLNSCQFGKKNQTNNQEAVPNIKPKVKGNPFTSSTTPASGTNKFKISSTSTVGSLPSLRQNIPKSKILNDKFSPKFPKNKIRFTAKHKGGVSSGSVISDERLKAYGINPKKFHKKHKYGVGEEKQQKQS